MPQPQFILTKGGKEEPYSTCVAISIKNKQTNEPPPKIDWGIGWFYGCDKKTQKEPGASYGYGDTLHKECQGLLKVLKILLAKSWMI